MTGQVRTVDGRVAGLLRARLQGDAIEFSVDLAPGKPTLFRGRITGYRMEPDADASSAASGWSAVRTTPAVPIDQPSGRKRG